MRLGEHRFDTEAEALAFVEGVELVNDDAVVAHEPQGAEWSGGNDWIVFVHDWDDPAEDICPVCGAGADAIQGIEEWAYVPVKEMA